MMEVSYFRPSLFPRNRGRAVSTFEYSQILVRRMSGEMAILRSTFSKLLPAESRGWDEENLQIENLRHRQRDDGGFLFCVIGNRS